ncbi:putative membrane protein [Pseudomonas sp. GM78]|uniref:GtrA family protein n=1 Tax=Pseudomonas sp. GM78 TaxID=1144337 RepID=UPI000270A2D7|nr:GtrA family protein [Pseudomonas sp. GM78]EJN18800.1 putative membrane protein [Pseudomonas sp. GM78]
MNNVIIPAKYHEFIIFGLVGVANTAVHASIVIALMEIFAPPAFVANGVAFVFANLMSYALNSRFTFKTPVSFLGYRRFLVVSLVSLALTLLITSIVEYLGWHYGVGLVMVILVVPVLNYLVMKIWAFAPTR